ncbi:MAG: diaminopimelate decarboxylase [Planctomycetota bacterium]
MPEVDSHFRSDIAGFSPLELTRELGTPLYVYDASIIAKRLAELDRFDTVRYAQKANDNGFLLRWLKERGLWVDAVSAGELDHALSLGFPAQGTPHPIVFTADVFEREALRRVGETGVHVNCGSADMIEQLATVRSGGELTLRINPGFGHGHSRKTNTGGEWSKHGIWHEEAPAVVDRARAAGFEVTGIHVHIGSGTDPEQLRRIGSAIEQIGRSLEAPLDTVSVGGGLPVPVFPGDPDVDIRAYSDHCLASRDRLSKSLGRPLRIEIEPGRRLVAEAGTLLTEILAIKRTGRQLFYLVDAGFHTLVRSAMYGAKHPIRLAGPERATEIEPTVVAGPLCESGDVFTQDSQGVVEPVPLPRAQVGDLLAIEVVGAYGFSMASSYNAHGRPAEVWIENGTMRTIRSRQSTADLFRDELL